MLNIIFSSSIETDDESLLMKKLSTMKQQLNNVKSLLSDKDIVDWNRFEYLFDH